MIESQGTRDKLNKVLKDPSKAAHSIIEVLSGGDAIRNDGVHLTAANKNPWYVLATIYGEQAEGAFWKNYDKELAAKNRRAWNGWFCADLDSEGRADRAEKTKLESDDLLPLSDEELADIRKRFCERLDDGAAELPSRDENIVLSEVYFARSIILEAFVFESSCYFDFSAFVRGANFALATFVGFCSFRSSTFIEFASFRAVCLEDSALFDTVIFVEGADFVAAQFCGGASFTKSEFGGSAGFWKATFNGPANFNFSVFGSGANFTGIHFNNASGFHSVIFRGSANFDRTVFLYHVTFNSAKFKSTTRFNDAVFPTYVPTFHAAELYDDTVFTLPENYRKNWPPLKGKGIMPAADQKRAYNRLRLFMNRSLQIDEEQFFHRMEMRCKAVLAKWYHKPLYWLFAAFSDYGNSIWRPIAWGALSVVAAAVFMLWWQGVFAFTPQEAGMDWTFGLLNDGDVWAKPREAFGWSISNALPFIGTGNLYYGGAFAEELAWPLRVVGGVQTLFGFVLLFLFGLGLRNRFRLR